MQRVFTADGDTYTIQKTFNDFTLNLSHYNVKKSHDKQVQSMIGFVDSKDNIKSTFKKYQIILPETKKEEIAFIVKNSDKNDETHNYLSSFGAQTSGNDSVHYKLPFKAVDVYYQTKYSNTLDSPHVFLVLKKQDKQNKQNTSNTPNVSHPFRKKQKEVYTNPAVNSPVKSPQGGKFPNKLPSKSKQVATKKETDKGKTSTQEKARKTKPTKPQKK